MYLALFNKITDVIEELQEIQCQVEEMYIDNPDNVHYTVHIGGDCMINTNITSFRKNIFSVLEQTIKFNEPVNVSTKAGNAVILSEEDYNGLLATAAINENPRLKATILEGMATPLSDCVGEDEAGW